MERSKSFIIIIFFIFSFIQLKASYKTDIYEAYIIDNMPKWVKIIDEMNLQKVKNNDFIMELVNYQYGYIAWCIGNDKDDQAEKYLDLAEKNIALLESSSYKLSLVNSYKSAFYGFRIGLNTFQAPLIGPKSVDCAKLAIKLDAKNPYGYIQYANSQYYMPAIFGGSKSIAVDYYHKAQKLMEQDPAQIKNDWNYLNLLTIMAKAYTDIEYYKLAKYYYEKILKIEPKFNWVKNELYPELLKKIK